MGLFDVITKPLAPNEDVRPENWDMSTITSGWENVAPVKEENMNEFLQLIMDLESSGGQDIYQKLADGSQGEGAGLYQLEKGPHQGGMTRLTRAYTNLPKELTPRALARHYKEAVAGDSSYDIKEKLYPHQQSFLMAANIMSRAGGRRKYDEWVASGKSKEKFLDWWLDFHWAGWQSDEKFPTKEAKLKAREDKKNEARKHLGIDITDEVLELENKENFLK